MGGKGLGLLLVVVVVAVGGIFFPAVGAGCHGAWRAVFRPAIRLVPARRQDFGMLPNR